MKEGPWACSASLLILWAIILALTRPQRGVRIPVVKHVGEADLSDTYRANADAYMAQLEALDQFIEAQVNTVPAAQRKLVTTHNTFAYFAERYGFEIVGTALGSVSTETADPPAQEIAALVDEIRAAGVPAIFTENVSNNRLMENIAAEADVELAPTLYTDALGNPGSDGATYLDMMRTNVTTIVNALRQ